MRRTIHLNDVITLGQFRGWTAELADDTDIHVFVNGGSEWPNFDVLEAIEIGGDPAALPDDPEHGINLLIAVRNVNDHLAAKPTSPLIEETD